MGCYHWPEWAGNNRKALGHGQRLGGDEQVFFADSLTRGANVPAVATRQESQISPPGKMPARSRGLLRRGSGPPGTSTSAGGPLADSSGRSPHRHGFDDGLTAQLVADISNLASVLGEGGAPNMYLLLANFGARRMLCSFDSEGEGEPCLSRALCRCRWCLPRWRFLVRDSELSARVEWPQDKARP